MSADRGNKKSGAKSKKLRPPPAPNKGQANEPDDGLYVVGVGGSAGGLEAFEHLLAGMPPQPGMAFVVVQHLDPRHKALMPEILQRVTPLKVVEIEDGVQVEPDLVYVLPPGHNVSIRDGRLWLSPQPTPQGIRTPVDFFFTSLAADKKEKSIGIIVSGMGTDGTLGIKAVKEQLGTVLVQSPASAKYDGMPTSAVATGVADYVAPIEDLPEILVSYVKRASRSTQKAAPKSTRPSSLQRILDLLRAITGHDFSLYKKGTLYRRIERRVNIHSLESIADYANYMEQNPNEANALFKDLFIGVTSFFRDPAAFEKLQQEIFPELLEGKGKDTTIRIWVAGCSTGEEAYSIVMALQECIDKLPSDLRIKIQVFATDIDAEAIETARRGTYPASTVEGVSAERLERFFVRNEDSYQVKKNIRETVVFAQHNIITNPPFTRLDMISCRNLLIYFGPELQKKLIPLFHYALNPNGILFLGSSETIGGYSNLFSVLDSKWKLYRRKEYPAVWTGVVDLRTDQPATRYTEPVIAAKDMKANVPEIAQRLLLKDYAPAAVVIDGTGNILYISGRTGKYLELPTGKANWNLSAMAREGLRYELAAAVRKAAAEKTVVVVKGVSVVTDNGHQAVDLTVRPFSQEENLSELLLVVFEDVPVVEGKGLAGAVISADGISCPNCSELEQELKQTKDYLQTTIEEMQLSQEELRSSNEEFQSTNEELQSTNEELMTSKEEMQSLNEELTTVNTELQTKNEELSATSNDMANLLNSTQIATIFLDTKLNIRRFTPSLSGIISLRQSDLGRPLAEIAPNFVSDDLVNDAKNVLDTLVTKEAQVQTRDGLWFAMRMMPYRTLDNVIDGVVVTFSDITAPKHLEESLQKGREDLNRAQAVAQTGSWRLDVQRNELHWSDETYRMFGIPIGTPVTYEMFLDHIHPEDRDCVDRSWAAALHGEPYDVEHRILVGDTVKWVRERAEMEFDQFGQLSGGFGTIHDITERKRAEQLRDALNSINASMISTLDFDGLMERVVMESVKAMAVESGSISLREDGHWVVKYAYGYRRLSVGDSFRDEDLPDTVQAIKEKKFYAVNDVRSNPGHYETQKGYGIRAFISIPLIAENETIGILWLNNHSGPFTFGEAEIDFATKLAASVSLALENIRLYELEREAKKQAEALRSKLQYQHGQMQQALLPGQMPAFEGYSIATRFIPGTAGEQIGGDFYDIFKTEDGKIAVLIGDVAGKGMEAGTLAAITRSTARAFAYDLSTPGSALSHTNSVIHGQTLAPERFATVCLAMLDPRSGKLTYSSAGHPPAMILRADGRVELLNTCSLPIRVAENVDYDSQESDLAPGDKFILYTDGISEAHSHSDMYKVEGMEKSLEGQSRQTPEQILDLLFRIAYEFSDGELKDDAAVIVIERCDATDAA